MEATEINFGFLANQIIAFLSGFIFLSSRCRTTDRRGEFLKHIRQIIRDSVRKMIVPRQRAADNSDAVRLRHSATTESHLSNRDSLPPSSNNSTSSKGSKKLPDNRYSMNLDGERILSSDLQQARSRTFADLAELEGATTAGLGGATSKNSVSSDASQGSGARLVHSSQDPLAYASRGSLETGTESPWERRVEEEAFNFPGAVRNDNARHSLDLHGIYEQSVTEC